MEKQEQSPSPVCPACHAACKSSPVHTFSAEQAAQHFVLAEEFEQRHEQLKQKIACLWNADHCNVLACPACGLKFAWPFVAGDGEFYNLAYPYSAYPKDRWEFRTTLEALAKSDALQGRVIEIGSGFGHFLTQLSPRFVASDRVVAIEYNAVARGKLKEAGFTAVGEDVRSPTFDAYQGEIGAIFMFQVLEHMDGLDLLLPRLRQLASDGASLFIAVPNSRRIDFNEAHGGLYDMPPNHISRWTKGAFEALAARAGLELVAHQTEPMSLPEFIKQDAVSSHMRNAQRPGSLANRLRARPRSGQRAALEGLLALATLPSRVPAWVDAVSSTEGLGDSEWAQFRFKHQP